MLTPPVAQLEKNVATYIEQMPKVDLHVHLEGSIKPETLLSLAKTNQITLPVQTLEDMKSYFKFRDFSHFVTIYTLITRCLKKPADYTQIAYEFGRDCHRQNIKYAEVTFTVDTNCTLTQLPWQIILAALNQGKKQAEKEFNIRWGWILDIIRDNPKSQELISEIIDHAQEYDVVGIGLTGQEGRTAIKEFTAIFEKAKKLRLSVVPHAGETAGPEPIWETLKYANPNRLGHGVCAIEDPILLKMLEHLKIPLEVCMTSNICLNIFKSYQEHPIAKLMEHGILVVAGQDDPALFNTDLINEYKLMAHYHNFSPRTLDQMNLRAIFASSLSKPEKEDLAYKFGLSYLQLKKHLGIAN